MFAFDLVRNIATLAWTDGKQNLEWITSALIWRFAAHSLKTHVRISQNSASIVW